MNIETTTGTEATHVKLLSPNRKERPPAPYDVLDWMRPTSWLPKLPDLIGDVVTDEVIDAVIADPPEYIVSDNLTWLNRLISDDADLKSLMTERLRNCYRAFRTCHATRTTDVDGFYSAGIRKLDRSHATQALRALLKERPEIPHDEDRFQHAFDDVGFDLREDRVFFAANETMIIKYGAHYLLYGGEHQLSVASRVWSAGVAQRYLRSRGKATIFICDVPLSLIGDGWLSQYAGSALARWIGEKLTDPQVDDFGEESICIHADLPAEAIVGHYHPSKVRDPFSSFAWTKP